MTHSAIQGLAPLAELRGDPLPRAKPDERLTQGILPEDFFGICAEELDDEFMESLRAIRQGVWTTKVLP
jgi:hypothetical protein